MSNAKKNEEADVVCKSCQISTKSSTAIDHKNIKKTSKWQLNEFGANQQLHVCTGGNNLSVEMTKFKL